MSPHAMGNQKEQQKIQLTALRSATQARLDTTQAAKKYLNVAITNIDSIGKVPGLTDVHKIGAAIKALAQANMCNADLNEKSYLAELDTLDQALKSLDSKVIPVGIGG